MPTPPPTVPPEPITRSASAPPAPLAEDQGAKPPEGPFDELLVSLTSGTTEPKWNHSLAIFDQLTRRAVANNAAIEPVARDFVLVFYFNKASTESAAAISCFRALLALLLDTAGETALRRYFDGFLTAPLDTRAQRVAARAYFCRLVGLPV